MSNQTKANVASRKDSYIAELRCCLVFEIFSFAFSKVRYIMTVVRMLRRHFQTSQYQKNNNAETVL